MKHLKLFEKFKNISENNSSERYEILGSFTNDDFDEFNEMTNEWFRRNGKRCYWDLCYGPSNKASYSECKGYWNAYVKPGYRMVLVEGNDDLFSVIVNTDGKIYHCCGKDRVIVHYNMPIADSNKDLASKLQSVIDENLDPRY